MKQLKIDNGQVGGLVTIFIQSMFIFNFFTFINTCAIMYHTFLHEYVSLAVGIILMFAGALLWWLAYYAIVYPSMIRFTNRQQYLHDSPIQKDLEEIKEMLQNENTSYR